MPLDRPGEWPNDGNWNGAAEAIIASAGGFPPKLCSAGIHRCSQKTSAGNADHTDVSTDIAGVRNLFTPS